MTAEQAIETMALYVQGDADVTQEQATGALAALAEAMQIMRQRYADQELARIGHIVREGMTPAQYHAAEARARAAHPEAWTGRLEIDERYAVQWANQRA